MAKVQIIPDKNLNTGDIVLTKGKSLASMIIMILCEYSHVAMLWRNPDTKVLYVIESTSLNRFSKKNGVQMSEYYRWLRNYNGQVGIRFSYFRMSYSEEREFKRIYDKYANKKYERNFRELISSAIDFGKFLFKNKENLKYLFCSEFLALILKVLKYIFTTMPCNEFSPDDFAPGGAIDDCLVQNRAMSSIVVTVKLK